MKIMAGYHPASNSCEAPYANPNTGYSRWNLNSIGHTWPEEGEPWILTQQNWWTGEPLFLWKSRISRCYSDHWNWNMCLFSFFLGFKFWMCFWTWKTILFNFLVLPQLAQSNIDFAKESLLAAWSAQRILSGAKGMGLGPYLFFVFVGIRQKPIGKLAHYICFSSQLMSEFFPTHFSQLSQVLQLVINHP